VGRELQLVWYATERDRIQDRHGRLVCVLEFKDCRKRRDESDDRYYFTAMLLEDLSAEYREWLGHQQHRGRPFGEDAEVLETEVRFSVAVQNAKERLLGMDAPAAQPFLIHQAELHELSSPQLDMIFDVMTTITVRSRHARAQTLRSANRPVTAGTNNAWPTRAGHPLASTRQVFLRRKWMAKARWPPIRCSWAGTCLSMEWVAKARWPPTRLAIMSGDSVPKPYRETATHRVRDRIVRSASRKKGAEAASGHLGPRTRLDWAVRQATTSTGPV